MAFYRSYKKEDSSFTNYSYTATLQDGTQPVQTTAYPINNTLFNYPIIIGNNVIRITNLFRNCTNFNQDVHIPTQVLDCSFMLADCPNFGSNIYYYNSDPTLVNRFNNILYNKNTSIRVNIFTKGDFNDTSTLKYIVGKNLTWTRGDGYIYNEQQNIYVYEHYVM